MPDYYSINWREYHQKTFHIDPAPFLSPFADRLPPGAHLLDIGCGSGRDLLWLKQRGFAVTGLERSPGLADLARQHAGCTVIEGDFETVDFTTLRADALLLSGSLVHVPHNRLPGVLTNVLKALKKESESASGRKPAPFLSGPVYISLKEGTGCRTDAENRTFYLWQDNELRALLTGSVCRSGGFPEIRPRSGPGKCGSGMFYLSYSIVHSLYEVEKFRH